MLNEALLVSSACKRTIDFLDREGYAVRPVKTADIEKIDAGPVPHVTSLIR